MAAGHAPASGAAACAGFLQLEEFTPLFTRWRMRTRISEVIA
jgi:hypothetical protein